MCLLVLDIQLLFQKIENTYHFETDQMAEFSEASSADVHVIFTDETLSSEADSASSRVFAVVSRVNSE